MMNHFFTFLFAAYGLAVYGQDNLIGEVYLSFQSSYNTVAIDGCEVGLSYMLQIEGTYGVANGSCNRDAAFGNFGNPTPHCQWVWNDVCDGCQDHRPTPDIYNPDHAYSYPFIAVSSEQTFHFQDLGGAGDNCGGLTMRIFTAGNVGCTSTSACNYDSEAVHDDGSCLYPDACGECEGNGLAGCTDALACNFNEDATCDDGGCDYSCCPGPGCCGEGTAWNWQTSECDIVNPADINLDGCVQLNDLLDLLSAYGDCGAEEAGSGYALSFDGVNGHVDFGNAGIGNVEDVTFEVLMKTASDSEGLGSNYQALLSKDCDGCEFSTGDWAILIGHNGNGVASFTINNSSGVAEVESGALNDEEWHWVSVTRNSTTGVVRLFIDGLEVDSDTGPVGLVYNAEKMYLAKYFLTNPAHYEGLVAEFRVWNRVLTDLEIATYLGAELQGIESGLVGLWDFSEGEGDVLIDQTNGGLDGQIIEATWTQTTETP